jgi:hypothetical protein
MVLCSRRALSETVFQFASHLLLLLQVKWELLEKLD